MCDATTQETRLFHRLNAAITQAESRLTGLIRETPLLWSEPLSFDYDNQVYIKPENLQVTGSFKVRGAYNKIASLTAEQKACGVVAASAGNHSQGVALASKKLGVTATIFMPKTTPLIKVDATKRHGAQVMLHGDCYDEAFQAAKLFSEAHGAVLVHPFDDLDVIAGQGSIGREILQDLPDVDCVLVPIGGGGLAAGVAAAIKSANPHVQVIGVEPKGALSMKASFEQNQVVCLSQVKTIADGVAVKRAGDLTYEICREVLDDIISVSDTEIMEAFCLLMEKHKLVGENAGVMTLAALRHLPFKNRKVVCLVSGGNIDMVTMSAMINQGLVSRGRLFCFSVELPDKPGELAKISTLLADHNANVIQLDHNQFKSYDRFMNAVLEVTCETNGHHHVAEIQEALRQKGYFIRQVF